jgi:hypothetical protein
VLRLGNCIDGHIHNTDHRTPDSGEECIIRNEYEQYTEVGSMQGGDM